MRLFHAMIFQTYHAYRRRMRPFMAQAGLSEGQPKILRYLSARPCCNQRELADFYSIEQATVSKLLAGMEEQGLIARSVSPESKRSLDVRITPEGRARFEQFERGRKQIDLEAFSGLTSEERERFLRDLQNVLDHLKQ